MKKVFIFLCFFVLNFLCFADLRDYVCIVRPNYKEDVVDCVNEAADTLEDLGYADFAEVFKLRVEKDNSFGSGFIYIFNGKSYVVTNNHVCAYADSVSVEMMDSDGKIVKKVENCKIIANSAEDDLAIAEIPADAGIKKGLSLYQGALSEGIDVWSAGYPGLGGKPSWQLGKGTLTNKKVKFDDPLYPKDSFFLQHSAPIDAGNSGGPLLITSKNGAEGYEVIGVNKAKARKRETTNFAIPFSTVNSFFKLGFSNLNAAETEKMLKKAESVFLEQASYPKETLSDEKEVEDRLRRIYTLASLISSDYAKKNGPDTMKNTLLRGPSYVRDALIERIIFSFPIDSLKFAVAYNLEKDINDYKTFSSVENISDSKNAGGKYIVFKNNNADKLYLRWIVENKNWKIADFSLNNELTDEKVVDASKNKQEKKKNREKKSGYSSTILFASPYNRMYFAEYNGLFTPYGFSSGGTIGMILNFRFFGIGGMLNINQRPKLSNISHKDSSLFSVLDSISSSFLAFVEPNLPMSITDKVTIMPYLQAGVGFGTPILNSDFISLHAKISPGIRFVFDINGKKLMIGTAYVGRYAKVNKDKKLLHGFGVSIGYSF
ncbi:S1 family peptidase [Treponema denticola]|uniref:S1 family peptidase n=1 Tax=Treponema denticola TaxID=158 RepID=UPI0021036855|nr:serine protease [Treponema denticola]UTY25369.1 serine protease [Treponema denticola]